MKNNKIAIQLFVITSIIIAGMIGVMLLVQSVFFEQFYQRWKQDKLSVEMEKFARVLETKEISYAEYMDMQTDFRVRLNADIVATNKDGVDLSYTLRKNQKWYAYTMELANGSREEVTLSESNIYEFLHSNDIILNQDYYAMIDKSSDKVVISFLFDESTAPGYFNEYGEADETVLQKVKFLDKKETTPQENTDTYWSTSSFYATEGSSAMAGIADYEQIQIAHSAVTPKGEVLDLYLVASLQPVDEATVAMASYYPWFFIAALLTALLVAYIFSKRVSKPIVKMSEAADCMAKGNLDTQLAIKQNNEIGVLGQSLNELSSNLKKSLGELQDANEQLLEDIAEKERQERIRREFTDNISHDLKTPLGVMRCYVDLIRDDIAPENKEEYFDIIVGEINKMNTMVLQMLQLAKAESGDIKLSKSLCRVEDMISDTVTMFAPMLEDKGIEVNMTGEYPPMCADVQRMEQVLTNLISNAVKYALPHTPLSIKGEVEGAEACVSITNGCEPITQEQADQLFKRFYMVDKSRGDQGTGLGLAICAAIFDLHGFSYGAVSEGDTITMHFTYLIAQ